jgi:hypothetical protein
VRRALLSVAIGLAGAAGVTASGWALQATALPPPTPAALVAADASVWFNEYRLVVDVFHFHHRRTSGACLRGWFARAHGHKARGSLLSLEAGPRPLPVPLAKAAGCSGLLAPALAAAAQNGGHLTVSRGYAANRAAIALKLTQGKEERLTLYVSPRTYRPLVAIVATDRREVTARIYLNRVRRRVLARFHLPGEVKPEAKR